jgi:hypothetical protein
MLKVLILKEKDLTKTSFKAKIITPLKTDSLTP